MPDFFMGQELIQAELPVNSPRPHETPPEGVIVVDKDSLGYTRRYLYKSMGGESSEILISETPPAPGASYGSNEVPESRRAGIPVSPLSGSRELRSIPIAQGAPRDNPSLEIQAPSQPRIGGGFPFSAQVEGKNLGGPTSFLENSVKVVSLGGPMLGQVPQKQVSPGIPLGAFPAQPASGMETPPPAPPPPVVPATCPGAVEMPDGRTIEPDDLIKLSDLCELMPFLLESYQALQEAKGKLAPGQKVPLVGQQPAAGGLVPSTASQFGPAAGPFGQGGGGFIGGGGGAPGPQGRTGAQGPPGPAGFGGIVEAVSKTDGDFSAGPGAFIPVPGTQITFSQGQTAPAALFLSATLGSTSGASGFSQSGQIGIRVDGVDYPLATRLLHTFVGGVGEFLIGQSSSLTLSLPAGSHTAEVVIRGLLPAEYGAGIGTPITVAAIPTVPLTLSVAHS